MAEILLLDQGTINKIAAGEVVERPSAVVKELVENAIDAGATAVTVEIKGGGVDLIRITDNGCGIEKKQIPIAFERHATSKIRSAEDLLSVSSLGFRGEALASIGAVSQVELVTKTRGELMGSRYVLHGGQEKALEDIGCPEGTTFVIRNLFYNVPARRKFLKSFQTEAAYISDLVERLAIANPQISFKFMNNNQIKLQTSGKGNLKEILYHIYGRDITSNLIEVSSLSPIISVKGFVAKPVVNRGNRNYMNYFINGRYIKSPIINKAVEEAYKPYMMQHRYPMTALQFTIDSQFIDVNVHPTKMEIRFTNGQAVYQAVYQAVSDVLAGKNMIPEVTIGKEEKKVAPGVKAAAEPFERKRKYDETSSVGKQMVEAAKVISKFEDVKRKQEQLLLEKQRMNVEQQKVENAQLEGQESDKEISQKNLLEEGCAYQKETRQEQGAKLLQDSMEDAKEKAANALDAFLSGEASFTKTHTVTAKKEKTAGEENFPMCDSKAMQEVERLSEQVQLNNKATKTDILQTEVQVEKSGIEIYMAESEAEKTEPETIQREVVDQDGVSLEKDEKIWDKTNSRQEQLFSSEEEQSLLSKEAKKHHRIIGQIFDTYWIVQLEDKMFIIDQHAAHEKVLFEKTMKSLADKQITSQMLQPPIILSLSMREEQVLKAHKQEFEKLGFEIEAFGGREFSVRAVPANLFGVAQTELLTELLDQLSEEVQIKDADIILEKVASMSCKAAIKGNMKMSLAEAEALIDQLMELENPYHCPHGRPVIVSMTKYEIEKKFKRIV